KRKPANVQYTFNQYDTLYTLAKARNIQLQLSLTGPAPAWATANHKIGPDKPNPKYYAEFVNATVSHFRDLIDRYSIWNEPNYVGWLAPLRQGPKIYRSLYTAGYAAAKAADPSAQVLIGETAPYAIRKRETAPLAFLRGVTCTNRSFAAPKCPPLKADGYAHHPYDFDHPPTYRYPGRDNATLATLGNLTGALDKLGQSGALTDSAGKPLDVWLTEYGFFGTGHRKTSAKKRGKYLQQAFNIALNNPRVREMLQYLLVPPRKPYNFFDTSIADKRGRPTSAFKALAKWAQAALKSGKVAAPGQHARSSSSPPPQQSSGGGSGGSGGGGTPPPSSCSVPELPGGICPTSPLP
ncbi:MAG: hypothetical protein ACJ77M_10045, partial [Thermoleophilaceae bacterium]